MEFTGLSRSSIYLAISKKEFPKPLKLGRRSIGWPEHLLEEWQKKIMSTHLADWQKPLKDLPGH